MACQAANLLIACLSAVQHLQPAADASHHFPTLDVYPSPNTTGLGGWSSALSQAKDFVSELNLSEKAYIVTGVPGPCVGNITPIARLGFNGLYLQDGPPAVRQADYASVFPAGLSAAASWDLGLIYQRGLQMGSEFKGKGANIALGPVAGPLGKHALGGRNWEGFSPDHCLPRLRPASHDYALPPMTTPCLPRLRPASHDYALPPTTTPCLPRLRSASHDYTLPPTTTPCLPRLPAASYDYPLPPTTTCCLHLIPRCDCLENPRESDAA